jgi:excisionase family DNA binding protein
MTSHTRNSIYDLGPKGSTDILWTVDEVAHFLRLEPNTIRSMSREKKLPAIKLGRVWRYQKDQIQTWLEQNRETNSP